MAQRVKQVAEVKGYLDRDGLEVVVPKGLLSGDAVVIVHKTGRVTWPGVAHRVHGGLVRISARLFGLETKETVCVDGVMVRGRLTFRMPYMLPVTVTYMFKNNKCSAVYPRDFDVPDVDAAALGSMMAIPRTTHVRVDGPRAAVIAVQKPSSDVDTCMRLIDMLFAGRRGGTQVSDDFSVTADGVDEAVQFLYGLLVEKRVWAASGDTIGLALLCWVRMQQYEPDVPLLTKLNHSWKYLLGCVCNCIAGVVRTLPQLSTVCKLLGLEAVGAPRAVLDCAMPDACMTMLNGAVANTGNGIYVCDF